MGPSKPRASADPYAAAAGVQLTADGCGLALDNPGLYGLFGLFAFFAFFRRTD